LKSVWPVMVLFVLVIGGLYIGAFTPSEAGAIGAFGAFIIIVLSRKFTKEVLISSLRETMYITCFVLTVLIGAMIFSTFLLLTGLPADFATWVVSLPLPRFFVLTGIVLLYIPLGCMIDALPMILLTIPVIFPVVKNLGFDSIWFGVIIVVLSELSLITPPVGMNLYIVQGVTKAPLSDVIRGALPFAIVFLIGIAILVAFPQIALFLPGMMK
jgi:C4-dicarboxylate transporter DctM subunit